MALAGTMPSATNVGGAPPSNMDPAAPIFNQVARDLMKLSSFLHRNGSQLDANKVAKIILTLQDLARERLKRTAKNQEPEQKYPNPGQNIPPLHAMGMPPAS